MAFSSRYDRRTLLKEGVSALAAMSLLPGCAPASSGSVGVLTFPGTYNVLIWGAQDLGFFDAAGLSIIREPTTTSMYLIESVNSERFAIGASSIDNIIAYNEGQGAVELERPARLFAFMNIQRNMAFPLVAAAGIETVEDLRGRSLAVDAVSTGFSFVLREILRGHGLDVDDYELVSVGNARDRLEALKAGAYAAAILTPPFDRQAEAAGLETIATSAQAFDQYQGTAFITSRYWAEAHHDELVAFTKALFRSFDWLGDPANAAQAAEIIDRHMDALGPEEAARAVPGLREGLTPEFNIVGIETVLTLRSRYGRPQKTLSDPAAYIDTRYMEAARRAL